MTLSEHADQAVANIRRKFQPEKNHVPYRIMGYGPRLQTGVVLNKKKFWHFQAGQIIDGQVMAHNGVKIQYPDGSIRTINNSFYSDINTDLL